MIELRHWKFDRQWLHQSVRGRYCMRERVINGTVSSEELETRRGELCKLRGLQQVAFLWKAGASVMEDEDTPGRQYWEHRMLEILAIS